MDADLGNVRFVFHQQRVVQFGQLVEAFCLAESVSISVNSGGLTPCCMDADMGNVRFASHQQRLVQD